MQLRASTSLATRPGRTTTVVCRASAERVKAGFAALAASAALLAAPAGPAAASVAFSNLKDGAKVSSPVHVEMAVKGLEVKPASEGLIPGTGHFHVVIDRSSSTDPLEEGTAIAFDKTHLHFGKGQTAADVELAPGRHTLTLQFANALHESYGPGERKEVSVIVQ